MSYGNIVGFHRRDLVRLGNGIVRITPDHGSEERRRMLEAAYHRNVEKLKIAEARKDAGESCRLRGNIRTFRQLLHQEYGVDINGK